MSKILTVNELLEAAEQGGLPNFDAHRDVITRAVQDLAVDLATHHGIVVGEATWEGLAFAGLCVPFYPEKAGHPCPEHIHAGDTEGDWEPQPDCG